MEIIIGIIVAIVVWVAMTLKQAKGSTANAIAFFENARANGTTPNLMSLQKINGMLVLF